MKDVSDIVDANNASEFGLFTDTALPSIPKGESPFPKDYPIERYRFDTVLLGREIPGKGSGPDGDKGPAFATQEVVEDTGVPTITLLGDKDIAMEPGLPYVDLGATATDPEQVILPMRSLSRVMTLIATSLEFIPLPTVSKIGQVMLHLKLFVSLRLLTPNLQYYRSPPVLSP